MLMDHKVRFLTAPKIKAVADKFRLEILGNNAGGVRAASAIVKLIEGSSLTVSPLKLEFKGVSRLGAPAVVSYKPLKLEIDRAVWTKALLSKNKDENYIVAHELGHIALHNHDAQPYSGIKKGWIDFEEESAEWQANKFADYFLVQDLDVFNLISPSVISDSCQVPQSVAERRFKEVAKLAECSCENCFGTPVYRLNLDHFCWTCQRSFM